MTECSATEPAVSILKPIHGADDHFWPAIVSHARIEYPAFEILFGVRDQNDTALPLIHKLQSNYPGASIRVVHCTTTAPNAKVGSLIDLLREARYPLCVVNDSDITVPSNYLENVAAPLEDAGTGLVTCLVSCGSGQHSGDVRSAWNRHGFRAERSGGSACWSE